jgi:energy-coupling factor transporter ATP-binding protein EcfA2
LAVVAGDWAESAKGGEDANALWTHIASSKARVRWQFRMMAQLEQPAWFQRLDCQWGARWVRCALQVNPYSYAVRHGRPSAGSEAEYNAQLVEALLAAGVELIAITDHYRVQESVSLVAAARDAGITTLLGFEASTSEGVHWLCIFSEDCDAGTIDRRIGQCGVEADDAAASPIGTLDSLELLRKCDEDWKAACIAAHATYDNGLLKHLSGQARIRVWASDAMVAAAIPGSPTTLPSPYREIVLNVDDQHRRDRRAAILNAGDVSSPADVTRPGATCRLKLSELSLDAVRQAFLDPQLRVRLDSDEEDEARPTVSAVHWDGGFLSGEIVQLADELTVLVGAPGAGKSTVIETLRAAFELEPASPRARADHQAIVAQVLKPQTTISVVVRYPTPTPTTYVVERTLPNPARVLRADTWELSGLGLNDLQPALQIYGQHEVAELAEDAARRTQLLESFVSPRPERDARIAELRDELSQLRQTILAESRGFDDVETQLSLLPGQEEKLQRYEEAGVAQKLELQTQFDREDRAIKLAESRLDEFERSLDAFAASLPLAAVADGNGEVAESPFLSTLQRLDLALEKVSVAATGPIAQMRGELAAARAQAADVFSAWKDRRAAGDAELRETKEALQDSAIDAESFRQLRARVDELKALRPTRREHEDALARARASRSELLAEHERLVAESVRDYERAAARVSGQLARMVQVTVESAPDHEGVEGLLRQHGGRLAEALELFRNDTNFSARDLAERLRQGKDALQQRWNLSDAQVDRLTQVGEAEVLQLEELEPCVYTRVDLNVSIGEDEVRWQSLESLSKGQKATAILLLLLLDSEAPLVVDQPEDDLDNRFIAERIVPAVRQKKAARQFVFSTHNANVPVLADAELIVGLTPGETTGGAERARVRPEDRGSIDAPTVKHLVEERLEGGRKAFLERRRKYGL